MNPSGAASDRIGQGVKTANTLRKPLEHPELGLIEFRTQMSSKAALLQIMTQSLNCPAAIKIVSSALYDSDYVFAVFSASAEQVPTAN